LTADRLKTLEFKWTFGFEGDMLAFAPAAVIGNTLFVRSASGRVHALDPQSSCTRSIFQAGSDVGPAIVLAPAVEAGKGCRRSRRASKT
jgi:hypothetical protein